MPGLSEKLQLLGNRQLPSLVVVYHPYALDDFIVVLLYESLSAELALTVELWIGYASQVLQEVAPEAFHQSLDVPFLPHHLHMLVPSLDPLVLIERGFVYELPLFFLLQLIH